MRLLEWPYWKIAEWLLSEHHLTVHKDTIRKFCIRRKITKGQSEARERSVLESESTLPRGSGLETGQKPKFNFTSEDEKPIEIH